MTCKYVVNDFDESKEYSFYDEYKFDSDGKNCNKVKDGLEQARKFYTDLRKQDNPHSCSLVKLYPDYKNSVIKSELIESDV